jgi:ABC-2 type transport system permease protein
MNKTSLILRNEIITTINRRSFQLIAIGVPLIMAIVTVVVWIVSKPQPAAPALQASQAQTIASEGFVDQSGIVVMLPPDIPAGALNRYRDEQAANQAITNGAITAYYVVPADYLASGKLYYVHPQASLTTSTGTSWAMRWALLVNLLGGDVEQAALVWNPMHLTTTALAVQQPIVVSEDLFMLPYLVVLAMYAVTVMSGSLLRNSLGDERKNRVQEILLTSASPLQLLAGKITALGIVGLLQMLLWASIGFVMLRSLGQAAILPAGFRLPPSLIAWAAVFFLLGYAVYGSLLAGLGALTGPNSPGSATADFVVIWPTLIPLLAWSIIVENPHGTLALILSLFPLTSPVAMLIRLVMGGVPLGQLLLSVALLVLTAAFVVRGVAAMFHAQLLLTGQQFTMRRYVALLLGRA